ncbi:MAG: protein kinase, partial [Acidobacteria bacterium]|nr:protein kinase [Acidobacteriota bacterium]
MNNIGKYRISGELGRGAMGIVYRAEDPYIERTVAIKTIRFDKLAHPSEQEHAQRRFLREARSAGNLSHPNIVTIYEVGVDEGLTFIAMEHIDGQSLEDILASGRPFTLEEVNRILPPIADALDYAHRKGIVHRDIKPGNILIDTEGKPHIVDFGIARISTSTMTQTSMVMGTPYYMPPEQIAGKKVDNRADIFSLGAVLYELLTCRKPFPGDNITTVIYKIVNECPIPARSYSAHLPDGVDHVILRALEKDPDHRYSTCRELAEALAVPSDSAGPDDSSYLEGTDLGRGKSRKPLLLVLGGMMAVVVIVLGTIFFMSQKDKRPVVSGGGGAALPIALPVVTEPVDQPEEQPAAKPEEQPGGTEAGVSEWMESAFKAWVNQDLALALAELDKVLAVEPENYTALLSVGRLMTEQGRMDEARQRFEILVTDNPGNPEPYLYLGQLYERKREPERAVDYLKAYVKRAPQGADASAVERKIRDLEEEIRTAGAQDKLPPVTKKPVPKRDRGETEIKIDPPVKKQEGGVVEKKPVPDPVDNVARARTLIDQGIQSYDQKKYDESIQRMEEALRLDPQNSIAVYYLNKAVTDKREAEQQARIDTLLRQANADLSSRNFERGIQRARQVLRLDGGNREAQRIIEEAEKRNPQKQLEALFQTYKAAFGTGKLAAFYQNNALPSVFQQEKAKAEMFSNLYKDFSNDFSAPSIEVSGEDAVDSSIQFIQQSRAVSKAN